MNLNQYIEQLQILLSLSFDTAEVDEITSEYQVYLYEEYKNGSDEKEIIRKFGKPSELAKKLRKESGKALFKPSLLIRLGFFGFYGIASALFWNQLTSSTIIYGIYFTATLFALWIGIGRPFRKRPGSASKSATNPRRILFSHLVLLGAAIAVVVVNQMILRQVSQGSDASSLVYAMLYFGMFFYLLSLLQSLFVFLVRDRRYFSVVCHGFGGVFSVLFLFHQYYNFDSASNLLNPILPALGIYFVGLAAGGLFHFLYDNMAKNRRVSNRMKDGAS